MTSELLGRRPLVDAFERRLHSLAQGVGAPLVVTGPRGAGHSSLAALLVSVARKRGALGQVATALDEPFGGLITALCSVLNVELAERHWKLAAALEVLPLVDAVRQAALVLAGVRPQPGLFTAGQAAHALRVVLRAVAIDRPVVLVFDGLDAMDAGSVEAFSVMASRPASKELVVGFAAPSRFDEKLAGVATAAIPALAQAEVQRLLSVALGGVAGPGLTKYVFERSAGVPRVALELLAWLDDGGLLADTGSIELLETGLAPRASAAARTPPASRKATAAASQVRPDTFATPSPAAHLTRNRSASPRRTTPRRPASTSASGAGSRFAGLFFLFFEPWVGRGGQPTTRFVSPGEVERLAVELHLE